MKLLIASALVLSLLTGSLAVIILRVRRMARGLYGGTNTPFNMEG